jgi:hypothetical protein
MILKFKIKKNQLLLSFSTESEAVSSVSLEILTEPKARNVDQSFSIRNPSGTLVKPLKSLRF